MEIDEHGNIKVDIEDLNILDKQTGVYRADYFFLRLNEEIKRACRYDLSFSFMMVGLKNRKDILEELDPEDIDFVIEEMGYNIKDAIRGDVDLAGHIEKGLFALILPETGIHGSYKLAKRIRRNLRKGLARLGIAEEKELEEPLTVNVGIIEVPADGSNSKMAIKMAKRALRKSGREKSRGIGLIKELEKYSSKKAESPEKEEEKEKKEVEDKEAGDYYLPFMTILSNDNTAEVEKPGAIDVQILKELEKKRILCTIEFEGEAYSRKQTNAFSAVKLLNQKSFIYVEDDELRTAVPCITPHFDLEIRDKVLSENIYNAGSFIYSYEELKIFNEAMGIIPDPEKGKLKEEEGSLLKMLVSFKGKDATDGKWIVDPNSPFDSLYMMVRRRFLFQIEKAPGIYYQGLQEDNDREALYPVYPNCRIAPFEALRFLKKNIAIELITEGGFSHIINNPIELGTFYQVESF